MARRQTRRRGGYRCDTGQHVGRGNAASAETPERAMGKFDLPNQSQIDIESRTFNQVSVMATVLKTIALYEDADVLGRSVRWNLDDPAGPQGRAAHSRQKQNAYYNRNERRLEFYYFPSPTKPNEIVYTSLSRDIVAHETGHAILDGIAPASA